MIVTPKDAETARRLLDEAEKQGLPVSVVKVAPEGFDVPDSVANPPKAKPEPKPEPSEDKPAPRPRRSSRSKKE